MAISNDALDKALRGHLAPSTQNALRLRSYVKDSIEKGELTREGAYIALQSLYDQYADAGEESEREAVADVMDCFDDWSPEKARL